MKPQAGQLARIQLQENPYETLFAIPLQTSEDRSDPDAGLMEPQRALSLYDRSGRRKYLSPTERRAFLRAARASHVPSDVRTFCETLTYTGCRISEALALTADRIDPEGGMIIFETLKKRRRGVFRAVPVPPAFLKALVETHVISSTFSDSDRTRLWNWSRATGWRRVSEIMSAAGIAGSHATPKGLRHGFGVHAVSSSIPLNLLQRWLGHSQISTTAIYADATGPEERRIAGRMWRHDAA